MKKILELLTKKNLVTAGLGVLLTGVALAVVNRQPAEETDETLEVNDGTGPVIETVVKSVRSRKIETGKDAV